MAIRHLKSGNFLPNNVNIAAGCTIVIHSIRSFDKGPAVPPEFNILILNMKPYVNLSIRLQLRQGRIGFEKVQLAGYL